MERIKTLVIGASENPRRYSFTAMQLLEQNGFEAIGLGRRSGKVGNIEILILLDIGVKITQCLEIK
jgi:hypothetical protein